MKWTHCRQNTYYWHQWFAWFPVEVGEKVGEHICTRKVWWEWVWRCQRGCYAGTDTYYSDSPNKPELLP